MDLIWWVNSPSKDIIRMSDLPRKSLRQEGDIVKLLWEDNKTPPQTKLDAKIIKIHRKYY